MEYIVSYQRLTVSSTAVGFTLPTGPITKVRLRVAADAPIRYRVDGTAPTATSGYPLLPWEEREFDYFLNIQNFKAIRMGAVDTYLEIEYIRDQ